MAPRRSALKRSAPMARPRFPSQPCLLASILSPRSMAETTNDATSTAAAQQLTILKAAPSLTIGSAVNPSLGGATVNLAATLTSGVNSPSGLVTWTDNGVPIGTTPLGANAVATFASASFAVGQHLLTASFPGDAQQLRRHLTHAHPDRPDRRQLRLPHVQREPSRRGRFGELPRSCHGHWRATRRERDREGRLRHPGTIVVDAAGNAALPVTVSGPGTHTLVAVYAGDSFHSGDQSLPLAQAVLQPTSSSIASSANPTVASLSLTLTAKVTPANSVVPTGTVTFLDGATTLGTAPLNGSGVATFSTVTLTVGQHTITAVYSGDSAPAKPAAAQLCSRPSTTPHTNGPCLHRQPIDPRCTSHLYRTGYGQGATPTGSVTFQDGTVTLGQATLSAAGRRHPHHERLAARTAQRRRHLQRG